MLEKLLLAGIIFRTLKIGYEKAKIEFEDVILK